MGISGKKNPDEPCPLPSPLGWREWKFVVHTLKLPPQQERILALIMQCKTDRQIAQSLGLRCPTVRTYLNRIFDRVVVEDRMRLMRRVFSIAIEGIERGGSHPS